MDADTMTSSALDYVPLRHTSRLLRAIEDAAAHGIEVYLLPVSGDLTEGRAVTAIDVVAERRLGVHLQQCRMRASLEAVRHARANVLQVTVQDVVRKMQQPSPGAPGPPRWPTGNPRWPRRD